MSHKVNPKVFRIKEMKDWLARGFYEKNFAAYLEEDVKIRDFLQKKIGKFGVGSIEIERLPSKINVIISTIRPGLIIGRAGEGIRQLKKELEKKIFKNNKLVVVDTVDTEDKKTKGLKAKKKTSRALNKNTQLTRANKIELRLEIREIKNQWTSASLVAQWVAVQIEKRVRFRSVLKRALNKVISQRDIKGAKIEISGRLNGVIMLQLLLFVLMEQLV
jgi:small subunit ribosomal protein S3